MSLAPLPPEKMTACLNFFILLGERNIFLTKMLCSQAMRNNYDGSQFSAHTELENIKVTAVHVRLLL